MNQKPHQFSGEEIIADVLLDFPTAHEILAAHGIACAGCHINQYETLREGIIAHYGDEMFSTVMRDLNEAAMEMEHEMGSGKKDPVISDAAKAKIEAFQTEGGKQGFGFKIEVVQEYGEPSYFLDFQERPDRGDKVVDSNGIKIFCDTNSYKWLQNKIVDYQQVDGEEGFKFEKI
jgi:Fe-S cluster assembly iron-binding protein IscA